MPDDPTDKDARTEKSERDDAVKAPEVTTNKPEDEKKNRESTKVPRKSKKREAAKLADSTNIDFAVPTLRHFTTYTRITQTLEGYLLAALRENRRLDHMLIHGRHGSGTSTLARALIRDYAPTRVEEFDAQGGVCVTKLKRALVRANRRGVVFIRHIELLDGQCAQLVANYMAGRPIEREERAGTQQSMRAPWESALDKEIAESARIHDDAKTSPTNAATSTMPGGTIIATALMPNRLSYLVRTNLQQLIHLRNDPKALRCAMVRVLRQHALMLDASCFQRVERVLSTLIDGTEQLARAVLARAGIESVSKIDDDLMKSIIEADLPTRIPDGQYAASLREHLGGRKILSATVEEVDRIAHETLWGTVAAQASISTMIRENRARKRTEHPSVPF